MVCNKDCFNCPYEDCIRPDGQDAVDRTRAYRKKYPERIKTQRKKQYIKHRETELLNRHKYYIEVEKVNPKIMELNRVRSKKWADAHREEKRAKDRDYYKSHADKLREYQRQYRAKVKFTAERRYAES